MFSSPLLPVDRTRLPPSVRRWVGRRLSGPPRARPARHWRAAIYQLDRLGDLVLATGAIRTLLAAWGETECLLVVSTAAAPLAAREFPRTPRIVLPTTAPGVARDLIPTWWRERPKFRGHVAQRVVCLSHHRDLYKETALSWIAAPVVHRLDRTTYPVAATLPWCLELLAHHQLVAAALGAPVPESAVKPRLLSLAPSDGADLLVCPVGEEVERCLPDEFVVAALRQWRQHSRARVVLSAAPAAADRVARLAARLREGGVSDVHAATSDSFDAFLARLAGAGAVLAGDSAPAHIATALDKRLVVVPGGGRFGLSSPWQFSDRQRVLEHRVPCYGCGWRCHQPEPYCLTRVSPIDLAGALPQLP